MKILVENKWTDGFLDFCPQSNEYTIKVLAWKNLTRSRDLYFVRPKSLRLLWNYLKEIGPREVLKKVVSRSEEKFRNEKFISCGIGRIIKLNDTPTFSQNQLVGFLAPNFPACAERISLPAEFIVELKESNFPFLTDEKTIYVTLDDSGTAELESWWRRYNGWSNYAGFTFNKDARITKHLASMLDSIDWTKGEKLQTDQHDNICFVKKPLKSWHKATKKQAVLFGYGNYAKTIIIPNIKKYLHLEKIHEIDPLQIPLRDKLGVTWSSCPEPCKNQRYDAFFIAGFHHTHAPLAVQAMEQQAYAVVEKPILVDHEQLEKLLSVMRETKGRLFACFHKRYNPMNKWAWDDLNHSPGEPISYHCIVYEVPLPKYHWYRWPNSKSRLISNGCHWTDHFLFLNNFSSPKRYMLDIASDGTINCSIELENEAYFTMTLTDKGSERIGVRDYIELRAGDDTVTIINGAFYLAENKNRILRKKKIKKMSSYKIMYEHICNQIAHDMPGDSIESVETSSKLILALEQEFQELNNEK